MRRTVGAWTLALTVIVAGAMTSITVTSITVVPGAAPLVLPTTTTAAGSRGALPPVGGEPPCARHLFGGYTQSSYPGPDIFGTCAGSLHVPKSLSKGRRE